MDIVRLRFGCTNRPFYGAVTAHNRPKLNTHQFQILGYHNPLQAKETGKRLVINCEKTKEADEESNFKIKEELIVRGGKKKGAVRLRFARMGHSHRPFYRVVAADSKAKRDGKFLEILGYYDPLTRKDGSKHMGINFERTKYWLSVGAQPTETVERLFYRAGLLTPPPEGGPRDKRLVCKIKGVTSSSEEN
uniref:TSA: Wollemia nobilis Ref_Wollemi_Transcript_29887_1148 transcribed RNA sequence n=1 Tax=Wollemia nobilis TaxID=56998 RepID=A0A0C9QKX2_9CONI